MEAIKKLKYPLKIAICIYLICCLIFKFGIIKKEILTALTLWANIIIPSVFPYLIISQYISNSHLIEKIPGRFISFVFGIHKCSIKAIICSVLCGYPSGAVCARSLYDKGEIDAFLTKKLEASALEPYAEKTALEAVLALVNEVMNLIGLSVEDDAIKCDRSGDCKTLPLWQGLDKVIDDYLESKTLSDLL